MCRFIHIVTTLSIVLLFAPSMAAGQIVELPHADTTRGTFFGTSVVLEGNRAVVGASSEDSCEEQAGAVYVFERATEAHEWERTARLTPGDCQRDLFFGREVALSGDRILVSASREFFAAHEPSAVFVFERDEEGDWQETARLTADSEHEEGSFGASIDLDGDRALITTWGDASSGNYHGAAYVFDYESSTGTWQRTERLTIDEDTRQGIFGGSAALDGDYFAVGASTYFTERPGSVHIFEYDSDSGSWEHASQIRDVDDFFIPLSLEGTRLLVGERRAGSQQEGLVRVIERGAHGRWHRNGTLTSPRPYREGGFGTDVALDGDWALVTGFDEQLGQDMNIDRVVFAYRYDRSSLRWRFRHVFDLGAVDFAASIDLDGPTAIIGRASEGHPGAAYVVRIPHVRPAAAID